jgi:hypothetical protein
MVDGMEEVARLDARRLERRAQVVTAEVSG